MAILESPSACIAAEEGVIAKAVLMPGDPLRAKFVAEHYLENPVCFNTVRNMLGYTGTYKGRKLSVMGHGMGVPSAGLYAHELYNFYGVDTIIRIGSAGGIGEDVKVRDVVLAMGASTNSHFADQYRFPGQLCATADYGLLKDAAAAAERLGVRADVGQVFTSDQFYNDNPEANATYRKFGILAVEMETAGIYWTAQRFGKRALSILSISDSLVTGEELPARLVEIAAARADRLRRKGTAWAVVECTETAAALLPLYFRQGFGLRALRPLESLAPCFLLRTGCVPARTAPVWVPLEDRVQLALLLAKGYAALDSRPYGGSLALALYPLKETE